MKNLVILPVYNEADNISNIVSAVKKGGLQTDILIIEDNSPDGTGKIVDGLVNKDAGIFVIHRQGKLGLGTAYITGFGFALKKGYDFIFEMDSDFSHNPSDLPLLLQSALKGNGLVIGSRYVDGVRVNNWPFKRLLLSKAANYYADSILRTGVKDLTAGFRCYRAEALKAIDLSKVRNKGYAFQIEMSYKIFKKGFRIAEIPIIFSERKKGSSKMSLAIKIEAFFSVLLMKFAH